MPLYAFAETRRIALRSEGRNQSEPYFRGFETSILTQLMLV